MGFIRLLLIVVLIYFLWRLIIAFVVYPFMKGYATRQGNTPHMGRQHTASFREKEKIIAKDKGEYVDFEEVTD